MIITFDPIIHDKIWGTEEWLLTEENVPHNIPKHLWEDIQVEAWGRKNPDRNKFPLALKVIDAKENLSLQVHPDKNELWYVLEAKEDAKIYSGFQPRKFDWNDPEQWLENSRVIPSKAQHSIQIQNGTCHALGAGNRVFELADGLGTTYRAYDWGRDNRELHFYQASQCAVYGFPELRPEVPWGTAITSKPMSASESLRTYRDHSKSIPFPIMPLNLKREDVCSEHLPGKWSKQLYVPNDSTFRYHYVLEGPIECEGQSLEKGQGFLVTASHRKGYVLKGQGSVLTVSFL